MSEGVKQWLKRKSLMHICYHFYKQLVIWTRVPHSCNGKIKP